MPLGKTKNAVFKDIKINVNNKGITMKIFSNQKTIKMKDFSKDLCVPNALAKGIIDNLSVPPISNNNNITCFNGLSLEDSIEKKVIESIN